MGKVAKFRPLNLSEHAMLYLGLMSGTSLDALDAALVDIADHQTPKLIGFCSYVWTCDERAELMALATGCDNELVRAGHADRWVAMRSAELINGLLAAEGVRSQQVRAIGSHGQTIRHHPAPPHGFTWQIGDGATLAELTGISVVNGFRQRDIAAGGQGAPLVPAFHQACFAEPTTSVAVLNLGGIANLTLLEPNQPVRGFDTGPANILMDAWCHAHTQQAFDRDGAWARSGQCQPNLLQQLLQTPYFSQPAPKSTGRELFNLDWLHTQLSRYSQTLAPEDIQATLLSLTATSVATALTAAMPPGRLIVCGGGSQNSALMAELAARLPEWSLVRSDAFGLPSQAIEAMAFAWLAHRMLEGLPGNVPEVTGAAGPRILGCYYPA